MPKTGRPMWKHAWKTKYDAGIPSPVVVGNLCFITSGYKTGCTLLQFSSKGVRPLWRNKLLAAHMGTPVIHDGHVYGFNGQSGRSGELRCIDLETGNQRWERDGWKPGNVILADGHLIALGEKGSLALIKAEHKAYQEVARFQAAEGRCWTVPVLAAGKLFIRSERKLIAYDIAK